MPSALPTISQARYDHMGTKSRDKLCGSLVRAAAARKKADAPQTTAATRIGTRLRQESLLPDPLRNRSIDELLNRRIDVLETAKLPKFDWPQVNKEPPEYFICKAAGDEVDV
jgi:hypothetical protein